MLSIVRGAQNRERVICSVRFPSEIGLRPGKEAYWVCEEGQQDASWVDQKVQYQAAGYGGRFSDNTRQVLIQGTVF
jgi:hypothetical protein